MRSTGRKLTAVLAAAVLLASLAYGIGTQAGGGGAAAADKSSSTADRGPAEMRRAHRGRFGPAALARKLGVSQDKLVAALEEIRGEMKPPGDRRAGLAADLAKELGVSEDKVQAAFEKAGPPKLHRRVRGVPQRFAAALAKELGIEASKVRSVFRSLRADRGERPDLGDVAQKLGVSEADLKAALEKVRPAMRPRIRQGKLEGRLAATLAKELGLDVADVRAALKKLRTQHESEHKARREAFAKALAEKLDIPVAKVLAALPKRGPGGHPGPGGPGGHHRGFRGPGGPGGPGGPPGMARPGSFAPGGPPPPPEGGALKF